MNQSFSHSRFPYQNALTSSLFTTYRTGNLSETCFICQGVTYLNPISSKQSGTPPFPFASLLHSATLFFRCDLLGWIFLTRFLKESQISKARAAGLFFIAQSFSSRQPHFPLADRVTQSTVLLSLPSPSSHSYISWQKDPWSPWEVPILLARGSCRLPLSIRTRASAVGSWLRDALTHAFLLRQYSQPAAVSIQAGFLTMTRESCLKSEGMLPALVLRDFWACIVKRVSSSSQNDQCTIRQRTVQKQTCRSCRGFHLDVMRLEPHNTLFRMKNGMRSSSAGSRWYLYIDSEGCSLYMVSEKHI